MNFENELNLSLWKSNRYIIYGTGHDY